MGRQYKRKSHTVLAQTGVGQRRFLSLSSILLLVELLLASAAVSIA
jgi:hypothetical protein